MADNDPSGNDSADSSGDDSPSGESTLTVVLALSANLAIAILKALAGALTGSAAMLSEAAHSVADTFTEVFLLTALRRSARPPDRWHPFGYGKERYFWSLLAAVSIFASGAVFSFFQGYEALSSGTENEGGSWVPYAVLGLAFVLEGVSWTQSVRQVRAESAESSYGFFDYLRVIDDPAPKTVLYEDSAALVGLVLALLGIGLHEITGLSLFDGLASILIGLLLAGVAFALGYTSRGLLIGRQAAPAMVRSIHAWLADRDEVTSVVDLLTMSTGADKVLLCARIDFDDGLTVNELEHACVRIDEELRADFGDLDEIFLEPVPRTDADLRARVLGRYGSVADRFGR